MHHQDFFRCAEILRNWAEIHNNILRIHNIEIEDEAHIQVWANVKGEKVDRVIRISTDDTLSIVRTIKHQSISENKTRYIL